jgi:hypothetical protein
MCPANNVPCELTQFVFSFGAYSLTEPSRSAGRGRLAFESKGTFNRGVRRLCYRVPNFERRLRGGPENHLSTCCRSRRERAHAPPARCPGRAECVGFSNSFAMSTFRTLNAAETMGGREQLKVNIHTRANTGVRLQVIGVVLPEMDQRRRAAR